MESEYLKLRALEPDDIHLLFKWENDPSIWHYGITRVPFSKFDLEQYVLNSDKDPYAEKQVRFMIDLKDTDHTQKTIGTIDLYEFDPANLRAGVGIFIIQSERNKGFAAQALSILINYTSETLHLHQLFCKISADNPLSLKLFQKTGFTICGEKKDWILHKGRWVDEFILQYIISDQ